MSKKTSTDRLLEDLLFGDDGEVLDRLAVQARQDAALAERVKDELHFSELLRQAFVSEHKEASEDLQNRVGKEQPELRELVDLACEGRGNAYDYDRLARALLNDEGEVKNVRIRLAEDEWFREALSESKYEEAFVEALETRMWAETKGDHFVKDLSAKLDAIDTAAETPGNVVAFPGSWWAPALQIAGAAAIVAIGAFFAVTGFGNRTVDDLIAEVVKSSPDAEWSRDSMPLKGAGVRKGLYELESGLVSLRFRNGNEMMVEGPATFEVIDDKVAFIHSGIAMARSGSESPDMGFTLKSNGMDFSNSARLIGIDARTDGTTEAVVFEGDAGICLVEAGTCREIYEFEAVKAEGGKGKLIDVPYNPRPFEKTWSLVAGVEKNLGQVRIELPGAEIQPSPGEVQVYVEKESFEPDSEVEVDEVAAGHFADAGLNPGQALQANGKLRSYLLQLWPEDSAATDGEEVEASLTFDHPVVGLIYSSERLALSDEMVGTSIAHLGTEDLSGRGLDSGNDWILLSEDRRTLNLRLKGGKAELDQIRVLVALQ